MPSRQRDDQPAMKYRPRAPGHDQAAIRTLRERRNGALDLARIPQVDRTQLYAKCRRDGLNYAELGGSGRYSRFAKDRRPRHAGRDLFKQFQPFSGDAVFPHEKTGALPPGRARLST